MTDCQSTFNRSMIDETVIGYMEDEEHNDQDTCMMMIWWFRNYHNYLLGGVKFMFSSLLVCRSVSLPLSSPSLCLSPSVPSSLRPPPPFWRPSQVYNGNPYTDLQLIGCKIVIQSILYTAQYSANFIDSSGPLMLKPCAKNCDTSRITWTVTPLPLMVVLMTAAQCLNKDLHINGYKKETWIKFDNCSISMPVYQSMLKWCNFDE